MAKTLKGIKYISLIPDASDPSSYSKCVVGYEVGSTDDPMLSSGKTVEMTLSGDNLSDAESLWSFLKSQVESDEGIS